MFGDVTFAQTPFAALGGNTLSAAISELATAFEHQEQVTTKGGFQDEASAAAYLQSVIASMLATQAELVSGADSVLNFANTLSASEAEGAASSAVQTNIANMLASQSELVAGAALPSAIATLYASRAEYAEASDAVLGLAVFPVAVTESVSGADAYDRAAVRVATVAEAAAASAVLTPLREANVYPTGIQLLLNINGVLVWAVIDDTQNPNWQNIVNAQGSGWTVISDTQTPGWTQIPS